MWAFTEKNVVLRCLSNDSQLSYTNTLDNKTASIPEGGFFFVVAHWRTLSLLVSLREVDPLAKYAYLVRVEYLLDRGMPKANRILEYRRWLEEVYAQVNEVVAEFQSRCASIEDVELVGAHSQDDPWIRGTSDSVWNGQCKNFRIAEDFRIRLCPDWSLFPPLTRLLCFDMTRSIACD